MTPWPVEGVVHPGLTAITGQPERGKTTLALSLAKAALDGIEWAGYPTNLQPDRGVLFMCESDSGFHRARSLLRDRAIVGICRPWDWTDGGRRPDLATVVQRQRIGLVVIDSLFAIARDENDQAEAADVLAVLQGAGCPVIVIHHSPKAGGRATGVQRYSAAYRQTLDVERGVVEGDRLALTVKVSGNDMAESERISVAIDWSSLDCTPLQARASEGRAGSSRPRQRQRRTGLTAPERARLLGQEAAGLGVLPAASASAAATALVGSKDQENPQLQDRLRALGLPAVSHRSVAELIRQEPDAYRSGYADAVAGK